jgi:adenylate cyclase
MAEERDQRRLAAILAADVVGYSRLMEQDEAGTLAALRQRRKEVLNPLVAKHRGRIFKVVGDGVLVEFGSAVDAVQCAVELQQAMCGQPGNPNIVLRIGINLGDVVVEGGDLYGDGVNIAARLEALAEPGGILLSGTAFDHIKGKVKVGFDNIGPQSLKNITEPVRAYRVTGSSGAITAASKPSSGKPSIAVLPFDNMSADPEQEYFSDGITEDIITELSRFHSLFVIARNSSFSYKGRSPDIRTVGRELGVRYVLEGSIRKSSNRIRVTAQLIDTFSGSHIWAERYDRVLDDIFAVQEEVTRAIVAVIAPQIESTEQSKAARRRPDNLSVYEICLLAWAHAWQGHAAADQTLLDRAICEARDALAIDPSSVFALHTIAFAHGMSVFLWTAVDREHALREANLATARAIELDSTDALGFALRAFNAMLGGQPDRYPTALVDAQRAHEINPNDVFVLGRLAWLEAGMGEHAQAIEHGHQILRLNPRDPRSYDIYHLLGVANFVARQYSEGIRWALRALNDKPEMIPPRVNLMCCYVGANDVAKARAMFGAGQKPAPEYVKSRLEGRSPFARPEDSKRATTFLRVAAGLEDPSAAQALR